MEFTGQRKWNSSLPCSSKKVLVDQRQLICYAQGCKEQALILDAETFEGYESDGEINAEAARFYCFHHFHLKTLDDLRLKTMKIAADQILLVEQHNTESKCEIKLLLQDARDALTAFHIALHSQCLMDRQSDDHLNQNFQVLMQMHQRIVAVQQRVNLNHKQ